MPHTYTASLSPSLQSSLFAADACGASGIRVLLVDDHQTLLWGMDKLINGEAPRMSVAGTARSSEEALRKAAQLKPDVIVLDLDLDGQSSLDILPALLINPNTQVLVLTGERNQSVLDHAIHKGARGVLRKDASAEHVLRAIEKVHQGELWLDRVTMSRVLSGLMDPEATKKNHPELQKQASLTTRERKIIHIIVEGRGATNKVLAQRLFISEHTLRNHLTSIYHKLGVSNRLELYVYAVKHQLGSTTLASDLLN